MKTFAALLTFFALLEGALAQKALITFTAARHEKLAVYFGTPSVDAVAPAPPRSAVPIRIFTRRMDIFSMPLHSLYPLFVSNITHHLIIIPSSFIIIHDDDHRVTYIPVRRTNDKHREMDGSSSSKTNQY